MLPEGILYLSVRINVPMSSISKFYLKFYKYALPHVD
jgi:hypothetical protein